ncbi:MAG TPA: hypothetical protein VD907_02300 [Verrucomicrobiae bacterium]|nr:hypothetical protein [Verrucomicrobiae bacterium]
MNDQSQESPEVTTKEATFIRAEAHPSWKYALVGVVVGGSTLGLALLLREFVVEPWTCGSADAFSMCSNAGALAYNIATVLSAVIGTVFLVKLLAFRPLLIAIASAVTLWGLQGFIGSFVWYEALLWIVGLYALSYWAFGWMLRLHHFPMALLLAVAVVCAARVALSA